MVSNPKNFLIIGGTHGVEPQSTYVVENIAKYLSSESIFDAPTQNLFKIYKKNLTKPCFEEDIVAKDFVAKNLLLIPDYNRYGLENNTRGNEHEVDLNRNFPATNWSSNYMDRAYFPGISPGSEEQTKALVKIIKANSFDLIISIHTNHFVKHANHPQVNFDGIENTYGHEQATLLSKLIELPLTHDIGYATNGSLGSYAKDLKIPCITLELDDKLSNEGSWALYGFTLLRFLCN